MATDNMKHRRLQELSGSDFEMADGQPDIRGWEVKNSDGRKVGDVDELIFDAQTRKVRYMIVDLDDNELDLEDREVLLPIGLAELHENDDDVIIQSISAHQLRSLPEYHKDHLDASVERNICSALGRDTASLSGTSTQDLHPEFYNHEHFNDNNLYRRRLPSSSSGDQLDRGMELRDNMGISGSEVEGYLADSESDYDRRSRSSVYREEEVEDEAAVPVNYDRSSIDQQSERDRLEEDDDLGDDNIRNVQNDTERRNREQGLPGDRGI